MYSSSAEIMLNTPSSAVWKNPFRPFYLLGALYGPLLMAYWLATYTGLLDVMTPAYPSHLFHGHEMIFGFAAAIIIGFILTALPSWAGTDEISGGRLVLLVGIWLAGRLAILFSSLLPAQLVMVADVSLFLVAGIMIAPGLLRARNKVYLVSLLIFAVFFVGNLLFHSGVISGDMERATLALYLGIYAIMVKFTLVSGYLTPIFTNNILEQRGLRGITFHPIIEILAVLSLILFIASELLNLDNTLSGIAALLAFAVHSLRLFNWKSLQIVKAPVVFVMHLAYGWMIICFALRAISDLSGAVPPNTWLHAFTVGGMGLMMMGLMTRVVLRHTGRPLKPAKALVIAFGVMMMAGVARVSFSLFGYNLGLLFLSALLWMIPFVVYLKLHGTMLLRPSLSRNG